MVQFSAKIESKYVYDKTLMEECFKKGISQEEYEEIVNTLNHEGLILKNVKGWEPNETL